MHKVNSDDMLQLYESGTNYKQIAKLSGKDLTGVWRGVSDARSRRARQREGQELIDKLVTQSGAKDVAALTDIFSERLIWPDVVSNTYFVLPDSTLFSVSSRYPDGKALGGAAHANGRFRKLSLKRYDEPTPRQVYLHQIVAYAFCQATRNSPDMIFVRHVEAADAESGTNDNCVNLYFSKTRNSD